MTKHNNYSEDHKKAMVVAFFKTDMTKTEFVNENHLVRSTFYNWLNIYSDDVKNELDLSEADVAHRINSSSQHEYTSEQKYKIVQETSAMTDVELGQYCLNNNLRESQIKRWAENCKTANEGTDYRAKYELSQNLHKVAQKENKELQKKIQELNEAMKENSKELERMKDALAEYAVRETTLKKFQAIFAQEKEAQ